LLTVEERLMVTVVTRTDDSMNQLQAAIPKVRFRRR